MTKTEEPGSPRIYVYKITFEGREEYYYGVHKERKYGEHYMGSPCTHKEFWNLHKPIKEILEVFDYSEEGWLQARNKEQELIRPVLNNPLCLNEACGTGNSIASRSANMTRLNGSWWSDPEYRDFMSNSVKEQWQDDNFREKVSRTISERNRQHWQDPERRPKLSEMSSARMKKLWEERREEMEKAAKLRGENKMWITDGTKEGTRLVDKSQEIPEGFRRGAVTGRIWITDGTLEGTTQIEENDPIPDGFRRGRVMRKRK